MKGAAAMFCSLKAVAACFFFCVVLVSAQGGLDESMMNVNGMEGLQELMASLQGGANPNTMETSELDVEPCPDGGFPAPREPIHLMKDLVATGCGGKGLSTRDSFGFMPCCNALSICDQFCGSKASQCFETFEKCVVKKFLLKLLELIRSRINKYTKILCLLRRRFIT